MATEVEAQITGNIWKIETAAGDALGSSDGEGVIKLSAGKKRHVLIKAV